MLPVLLITLLLVLPMAVLLFVRQPSFGKKPTGARLAHLQQSTHFQKDKFQNLHLTPQLSEGARYTDILREWFFQRNKRIQPAQPLITDHTDLLALPPDRDVLVWFGHSSYFMQIDGKKILVDPVFSGSASPIRALNRSFPGSDAYQVEDLPDLDYLLITHDHWDHLDYETVKKLRPRVGKVVTGLGTGAHLEHWGFAPDRIFEKDWNDTLDLGDGFTISVLPARHFSGRGLLRNPVLWVSFALKTPSMNLYLGGDSGYDDHFREIGQQYGPFDLAILECGQYNTKWKYIHLLPQEVVQAALDLHAKRLLPVHWGKFAMANHAWDEPLLRVTAAAEKAGLPIVTPLIGEALDLKNTAPFVSRWTLEEQPTA